MNVPPEQELAGEVRTNLIRRSIMGKLCSPIFFFIPGTLPDTFVRWSRHSRCKWNRRSSIDVWKSGQVRDTSLFHYFPRQLPQANYIRPGKLFLNQLTRKNSSNLSTRMSIISKKNQICISSRFYHKLKLMNPNAILIHQALIPLQAPCSWCEYWWSLRNSFQHPCNITSWTLQGYVQWLHCF